ncbi:MAG: hypothetical protein WCG48_01755 [Candidatus Berkelbacteria bacterium]
MSENKPQPDETPLGPVPVKSLLDRLREETEGGSQETEDRSQETVETIPPVPPAVVEEKNQSRERKRAFCDKQSFVDFAKYCIDGGTEDLIILAEKDLAEKRKNQTEADNTEENEAMKEGVEAINRFIFSPEWKTVWQKFDALKANPEYANIDQRKKDIQQAILMPVINGHLTAQDAANLVSGVDILPENNTGDSTQSHGYDGILFYSPSSRKILIAERALKDKYTENRNGTEVEIKLNFGHMISHEMGHGLTAEAGATPRTSAELAKQITDKEPNFTSKMLSEARKMIDNAAIYKDAQPMHVKTVLEGLSNIGEQYDKMTDPEKQKVGTLENYTNIRKIMAADEIITDYTAVFLQTDGSFADFAEKCILVADKDGLSRYLAGPIAGENIDATAFALGKLRQINGELTAAEKKEQATDDENFARENPENAGYLLRETREDVLKKYPEISRLLESYQAFYGDIVDMKGKTRGKITMGQGTEDDDMISEGYGGGFDGGRSMGGSGNDGIAMANDLLGIAHHLLSGVGVVTGSEMQIRGGQTAGAGAPIIPSEQRSIPSVEGTMTAEQIEAAKKEKEEKERLAKEKEETEKAAATSPESNKPAG